MKIFITGAKGARKSTLVQTIIQEQQLQVSGFLTLPYMKMETGSVSIFIL